MTQTNPDSGAPAPEEDQPRTWLDRIIFRVGNLLSLLFLFTVAISFYEVVMRYAFNSPTMWVHETATFLGGMLFLIGGAYALSINKHVRVVLLYDAVSEKTRRYLNVFHHVMGLILTGLLTTAAYTMSSEAWFTPWGDFRLETTGSVWNPPFPALTKGLVFLVLILMFCQFALHLAAEIRDIKRGNK